MSGTARPSAPIALLADVGGTNARFALLDGDGRVVAPTTVASAGHGDLGSAIEERLRFYGVAAPLALRSAAVAVAGPVTGDRVELTNVAWSFSISATRERLGLDRLEVINDLAALAYAVAALGAEATETIRDGAGSVEGVAAVLGVGTGLGVGALVTARGLEVALSTEGGHRDLAATTGREWRVVEALARRFGGHVSAERVLSGPGLATLHAALADLDGAPTVALSPEGVGEWARAGEPRAVEALTLFSGWLGAFAGDLALTLGARAGVWLGGGVLPALGPAFDRELFVERFLAKGRFRSWLETVPVRRIVDPNAALRGLARVLRGAG